MAGYFPLLGEPLALDLVNTVINRHGTVIDLLTEPAHLAEWLAAHPDDFATSTEVDTATLDAVLALRTQITVGVDAVTAGQPVPAAVRTALNQAALAAPAVPQLTEHGRVLLRAGSPEPVVRAILAEAAIELFASGQAERIRQCAGADCVLRFVPVHPRRQWCSPAACGNRARVARHYHREHPATPTAPTASPSRTRSAG